MDQKKLTFIPHIMVVLKGATVDFLNSDSVGHNVYWPSIGGNKKFAHNLGTWPQGVKKSFTFEDVGAVPLLCNVHPEMEGYVVVVETPYFAVSATDGSYSIKNVPPGKYTLKIWHEKLKGADVSVEVPEKGAATVDFDLHR